jgi:hypothetical protein
MVLILYLDDFGHPTVLDGCCPEQWRSLSSGVQVSVHSSRSAPDMSHGVAVSPGTETTLMLTQVDRRRQAAPYGHCTTRDHLGDPKENIGYSNEQCESICQQDTVFDSSPLVTLS